MKIILSFALLLSFTTLIVEGRKKCGIKAENCLLLSTGKVFWPSDWTENCSATPICPVGYVLEKKMIGRTRACCCALKRIEQCAFCDMSLVGQQTFFNWIESHLLKNGPADGSCPGTHVKRIFFGGPNQLNKCCCEPKDSPYLSEFEA